MGAGGGGGRSDSAVPTDGGREVPASGFGCGDVVILELLGDLDLLPDLRSEIDYVVFPFSDEQVPAALEISQQLRRKGRRRRNRRSRPPDAGREPPVARSGLDPVAHVQPDHHHRRATVQHPVGRRRVAVEIELGVRGDVARRVHGPAHPPAPP